MGRFPKTTIMQRIMLILPFFFLTTTASLVAQQKERTHLKGKIVSQYSHLEGMDVINLNTEKGVKTIAGGYFDIKARVNDTLMFSAFQFKGKRIVVTEEDLEKDLLLVQMEVIVHYLDEVMVMRYDHINPESLGIVPKNQKKYTPAERKLKAASGYDATLGLNTSFSLDPLFNIFSGRTKMLEKALVVEKKDKLLRKIEAYFTDEFIREKLQIEEAFVDGFKYYIVDDPKFVEAMSKKDKTTAAFVMGELAEEYKKVLADVK